MGYNTTVVVMNDALDAIKRDPHFGKSLHDAVLQVQRGESVDVPAYSYRTPEDAANGAWSGCHGNAATVIESHHADVTSVVAVGGNYGQVIGHVYPYGEGDYRERVLRELARELGFRVSRIASK